VWASGDAGYDASNPYRNSLAKYVLPSYNEWYKAAYYNPSDSTYYDYANGSDTRPTAVISGTASNTAVYTQSGEASPTGPADVNNAGGLSPYGVMGLGGNVYEWEESSGDLLNSSVFLLVESAVAACTTAPASCLRLLAATASSALATRATTSVFVSQVFLHPPLRCLSQA
jgi:formylglycine-generating enzyme required for sulfatase activity